MTNFLIYLVIAVELLMLGIHHLIQWKINNKRRKEDFRIFIMNSFLSLSFLFYGVKTISLNPQTTNVAKIIELIVDLSLLVTLAIYFIKQIYTDYINK